MVAILKHQPAVKLGFVGEEVVARFAGREAAPILALVVLLGGPAALANPMDCQPSGFSYVATSGLRAVRVNATADLDADSIPAWSELGFASEAEAVQAVVLGLSQLNEQGHGGYFVFVGTTEETDIPVDETGSAGCDDDPFDSGDWTVDYSLVVLRDSCSGNNAYAQTVPRCGGDQFLMRFWRSFLSGGVCTAIGWGNGAISAIPDVASGTAHEGIHAQDIGHPAAGSGIGATVSSAAATGAIGRNLFQYDLECTNAKRRSVLGYKRSVTSSGVGSAVVISSTEPVTKAAAGMTYVSGSVIFVAGLHRGTFAAFDQGADGGATSFGTLVSQFNGVGMVPGLARETPAVDRVFYSYFVDDPSQTNWSSVHTLRQIRSTNKFTSSAVSDVLECLTSGGWYTCATTAPVRTTGRVAVAYLGDLDVSLFAWTHHDKGSWGTAPTAEEIRIAIGMVDDTTLPISFKTGIRSAVSPGMTCREDEIGGSDCILLYVPIGDRTNPIMSRRFSVSGADTHHYTLAFDAAAVSIGGSAATGNPLAVWYIQDTDEIYVSYRSSAANQRLQVRKRSNAGTWSAASTSVDDIIGGPTVASMWRGTNNVLIYTK
jgi:hypothetical protein